MVIFFNIPRHWRSKGSWVYSSWKRRACVPCLGNTVVADGYWANSLHSTVLTFFNIFKTTVCLLNITFVLDRCPAAAGIPVKYYCDSKNLTVMSMKIKYFLTEKLTKEGFVTSTPGLVCPHDDVIKWKHFAPYWPFVWGIPWSPVNSPHKGQWDGALKFSLICTRTNGWANNRNAGELRHNLTHYDVTVMEGHIPGHQCACKYLSTYRCNFDFLIRVEPHYST